LSLQNWLHVGCNWLFVYYRQQERIGKEREEVERQRKLLSKRKPPVATAAASKQPKATKDGDVFLKPADKPLVTDFYLWLLKSNSIVCITAYFFVAASWLIGSSEGHPALWNVLLQQLHFEWD